MNRREMDESDIDSDEFQIEAMLEIIEEDYNISVPRWVVDKWFTDLGDEKFRELRKEALDRESDRDYIGRVGEVLVEEMLIRETN